MRGKFSFLYVDIWFDLTKCKFIVKNISFKMLVVLSPVLVADIKKLLKNLIYVTLFFCNFVAPLKETDKCNFADDTIPFV